MLQNIQALKIFEQTDPKGKRIPFQVGFVTANRDNWRRYKALEAELKTLVPGSSNFIHVTRQLQKLDIGGELIRHDQCTLSGTRGMHVKAFDRVMLHNPNHWKNRTRNLVFHPSGQIRKVHVKLILEVNNKPVLY